MDESRDEMPEAARHIVRTRTFYGLTNVKQMRRGSHSVCAHRFATLPRMPILHPVALSILIVFTITGGLALDRAYGVPGQIGVTVFVWGLFVWLCKCSTPHLRARLMACVWISGLGEIGASLLWQLYDYQFFNVPLFVPPGHALLYLFGITLAERLPPRVFSLVPWLAAPAVLLMAWTGADTLSLWLYLLFVLFMLFGRDKKLYATMFVIALAMEIVGTGLGNWTWHETVRLTSLTTLNPPLAAGAFYCVLDWLVGWRSRFGAVPAMVAPVHLSAAAVSPVPLSRTPTKPLPHSPSAPAHGTPAAVSSPAPSPVPSPFLTPAPRHDPALLPRRPFQTAHHAAARQCRCTRACVRPGGALCL